MLEAFGFRVGLFSLPVISPIIPNVIRTSRRASGFLHSILQANLFSVGLKTLSKSAAHSKVAVLGKSTALKIEWFSTFGSLAPRSNEYSVPQKLSSFVLLNGFNNTLKASI